MTGRTTLTKSLHTVTAVSRVASSLVSATDKKRIQKQPIAEQEFRALQLVYTALNILGLGVHWHESDETFKRCVLATVKELEQ